MGGRYRLQKKQTKTSVGNGNCFQMLRRHSLTIPSGYFIYYLLRHKSVKLVATISGIKKSPPPKKRGIRLSNQYKFLSLKRKKIYLKKYTRRCFLFCFFFLYLKELLGTLCRVKIGLTNILTSLSRSKDQL